MQKPKLNEIFTIPNILSMFRIVLLPFIVWFFVCKEDHVMAIVILLISGLSDILDGFIARKFNMISDFGKIIDPVADKLTQGILLICLIFKYAQVLWILGVFILKEFIMIMMGYMIIKRKNLVNSAKWYGKLNTVIIYSVIFFMIILPDIPESVVNIMVFGCTSMIIIAFVMYVNFYRKILFPKRENNRIEI